LKNVTWRKVVATLKDYPEAERDDELGCGRILLDSAERWDSSSRSEVPGNFQSSFKFIGRIRGGLALTLKKSIQLLTTDTFLLM
jgi:hypothetical protein